MPQPPRTSYGPSRKPPDPRTRSSFCRSRSVPRPTGIAPCAWGEAVTSCNPLRALRPVDATVKKAKQEGADAGSGQRALADRVTLR